MNCILCGVSNEFDYRLKKCGYEILECRNCGVSQISPRPESEALAAIYDETYFCNADESRGYMDYAKQEPEYLATFGEDVRRICGIVPRGRLLDVGCGFGYFLRKAAEAGFDCYGIDLAGRAVDTARQHLPGRIFQGTLNSVQELRDERFDVIFASHVIEHIPDPRGFVSELASRLNPGGIIVFITPNIRSLLSRASGSRWVHYKVPEHVAFYDPGTIRRLFDQASLKTLVVESAYQYYQLPFVAEKIRHLIRPADRIIPRVEHLPTLRRRIIRVNSASIRAIARLPS